MKSMRLTQHAVEQCAERGATEAEVKEAIERGPREQAKHGRFMCRLNFQFESQWQDRFYATSRLLPWPSRSKMRLWS